MPKCLDCDNTFKFYIPTMSLEMHYYTPQGDVFDSEVVSCDPAPIELMGRPSCVLCESTRIEGRL